MTPEWGESATGPPPPLGGGVFSIGVALGVVPIEAPSLSRWATSSDPISEVASGAGSAGAAAAALCPGVSASIPVEITSSTSASTTGNASRNAFTWSGRASTRSTRLVASPDRSCCLSSMTAAVMAASLADLTSGSSSITFSTLSRPARRRSLSNSFLSCSIEIPSRSRTAQTVLRLTPSARAVAEMLCPSACMRTTAA